jgi:DNA-nicking Smr family endonuclease
MHPFRIGEHAAPARRPVFKRDEPETIEPRRKHRIARERDPIGARIDLHGMTQERARAALHGFLRRSWEDGYRAVLVITGKGSRGDGVLRRQTPEWLADPSLREIVAGISEAHRRHGGEGALYVALKRRPPA